MTASDESNKSFMVVLTQDDIVGSTVESLKDINSQDRQYFVKVDKNERATKIYEIQGTNASDKYSSFFIDTNVVSDGTLNVCTKVDPLFFILPVIEEAASKWVPSDQICTILPFPYSQENDLKQLNHLCNQTDELGDVMLYKFSEERTLRWLVQKHQRTYQVMTEMLLEQKEARAKDLKNKPKALILEADDDYKLRSLDADEDQKCILNEIELKQCKIDAYDCVCEYLTSEWRNKLGAALSLSLAVETTPSEKKGIKRESTFEPSTFESEEDKMQLYTMGAVAVSPEAQEKEMKKKLNLNETRGLKKLKKASTKGMKNIGSFFAVKKK